MIDALGAGMRAIGTGSAFAYPLLFGAGIATSAGPCVAPRYIAIAAVANASRSPGAIVAAFITGMTGAYVALGLTLGALGSLVAASRWVDTALAVALAAGGLTTLLRDRDACGVHEVRETPARISLGGTLLLGASSAFVVSPCCTPAIAGIAGLTMFSGRTLEGALLLVAFALGHAVPIVVAAALGRRAGGVLARLTASAAPAIVAGTLMLALAAYYGVLA